MKKGLFGLGVVAALSFPVVGMAYGESEPLEHFDPALQGKFLVPSASVGQELYSPMYVDQKYPFLFDLKKVNEFGEIKSTTAEGEPYTLDGLQHFSKITNVEFRDGYITDLRPISGITQNKELNLVQPLSSLTFLKGMKNIEVLDIEATNIINDDAFLDSVDEKLYALTDLSVINELCNLKVVDIHSQERLFPTISLKKSMNKYVLVNPFILSKQFKNSEVEITSKTPGFTFEDDILTWDGITPETNELQISWEFNSNENGSFEFSGDSVIPINWID